MFRPKLFTAFVVLVGVVAATPRSCAILLDWNPQPWTSGNLSRSFDLDPDNAGNDVSIVITGTTGAFDTGSPNDTTDLTGGFGGSQQSLFLAINSFNNRSQSVTVTISFNYGSIGVSDVNFTLFDVDYGAGSYQDKIFNIIGITPSGGLVAPSITTSADNTLTGSGTNQFVYGTASTGSSSGDANVGIDFGTNVVTQVKFSYGNHTSAPSNPGLQWVGLYDISYSNRIPEYHPGLVSAASCVLLSLASLVKRRFRSRTAENS